MMILSIDYGIKWSENRITTVKSLLSVHPPFLSQRGEEKGSASDDADTNLRATSTFETKYAID